MLIPSGSGSWYCGGGMRLSSSPHAGQSPCTFPDKGLSIAPLFTHHQSSLLLMAYILLRNRTSATRAEQESIVAVAVAHDAEVATLAEGEQLIGFPVDRCGKLRVGIEMPNSVIHSGHDSPQTAADRTGNSGFA